MDEKIIEQLSRHLDGDLSLEEERELDFSHPVYALGRFRVNVFFQRDAVGAVMRAIPSDISTLEALNRRPARRGRAALTEWRSPSSGRARLVGPRA